jgi:peptidoglycan/xylan/chitin deacetylase (PgdA/CDA1 family)
MQGEEMMETPSLQDRGMSWLGRQAAALAGHRSGLGACFLTFHRATPQDTWSELPNRDFYLKLEFLDELLPFLRRTDRKVVTIDEILDTTKRGKSTSQLVNISVDDCYVDTWEHVVPLFRRRGVPVTLFVSTGIPDGTMSLSWSGLETIIASRSKVLVGDGYVDVARAQDKLNAYASIWQEWEKSNVDEEYAAFCKCNDADPGQLRAKHAITWDMLRSFRADPYVEIGSHTISHPRVSSLSAQAAAAEIAGSARRLHECLGVSVRHFAFPYGRRGDCGPREFALVRDAGLASALTTRKGLFDSTGDPFNIPRNTISGARQNRIAIEASLSGLSGVVAAWLGRI